MRNIILLCCAGMSTSFLVNKMKEVAKEENYNCTIKAYSLGWAEKYAKDADIILLGPQIRFSKDTVEKLCPGVPISNISMKDYGSLNGKKVLSQVRKILGD